MLRVLILSNPDFDNHLAGFIYSRLLHGAAVFRASAGIIGNQ